MGKERTVLVGTPEKERPVGTLAGGRGCGGARLRTGFVWPRTGIFGGLMTTARRQGVF
jgi:hypothetical protein